MSQAMPTIRWEAGTNYRDPTARKGARVPTMLLMILSYSVVSLSVDCKKLPFQTKVTLHFQFSVKNFIRSPRKFFFTWVRTRSINR